MRDIRASAEVAGMIGAENLHRLRHSHESGPFTCWHCHGPGDANTEPATVIAEPCEGAARIALAHAECARSQVVSTGAPAPSGRTEPGTGRIATRSGGAWHCRALTAVLPGPDGPLPLLILDQRPGMAVRGDPDERVNLFVSDLLSMGLTLVDTELTDMRFLDWEPATISEPPAPAPGWRLELSARRTAWLTAPDGSRIYSGECGQPRPWRALITRTSQCVVLIGAIGLYPSHGERAFTRITTLLDQAAHVDELVGGLVAAAC